MSYADDEKSIELGEPVELYMFRYHDVAYTYTSSQYSQSMVIGGKTYVFSPEYIKRGESLNLSDSGSNQETCTIEVLRLNAVALLYNNAPPEQDIVEVQVFRKHGETGEDVVRILRGTISQVVFSKSYATLTITIESVLSRNIPKGTLSYFCQNCIYDDRCTLDMDKYAHTCYTDRGMYGTRIYSTNLLEVPSGYFTDGFLKMGDSFRAIVEHKDDMVRIKYPVNFADMEGSFLAYPGCSNLFAQCARKFNNTDNFSGVPYVQPYDVEKHVAGKSVYWVNSSVIVRDTHGTIYG